MIRCPMNTRENCARKCFRTKEKETRVKFNPGLSANRSSNNNWALQYAYETLQSISTFVRQTIDTKPFHINNDGQDINDILNCGEKNNN